MRCVVCACVQEAAQQARAESRAAASRDVGLLGDAGDAATCPSGELIRPHLRPIWEPFRLWPLLRNRLQGQSLLRQWQGRPLDGSGLPR